MSKAAVSTPLANSPLDIAPIRKDFPILSRTVYDDRPLVFLDSGASAQKPRQVIDTMREVMEHDYANVHRGVYYLSQQLSERYEAVRDVVRALNEAVLERQTLRIEYTTARSGEVAVRELDPYRLWYRSGGLYVVGHDHKSGEVRTFAVERIRDPQPTGAGFEVAPDFDFEAYTAAAFGVATDPVSPVRLRFEPNWALHVKEHVWHASQRVTELADGRVELAMEVGVGHELRNWILSFGAGVEVLEPESLRRDVRAELLAAAQRYA